MKTSLRFLIVSFVLSVLSACTVPLPAERVGTRTEFISDRTNFFCTFTLDRTLSGPFIARPRNDIDEVLVGYDNTFFQGADPFPCNSSLRYKFLGLVRFTADPELVREANARGGVLLANLSFTRRSTSRPIRATDPGDGINPRGNNRCNFVVLRSNVDWESGYQESGITLNPGATLGTLSSYPYPIVGSFSNISDDTRERIQVSSPLMTRLVKDWAEGRRQNCGFVLSPRPDDPELSKGNNASCTGYFQDFRLEVTIPDE